MYSKQVKALTAVLETGFNLVGDLLGPLTAHTIPVPEDFFGTGWELFLVREEIVSELVHLGRSISVDYDSADVALATALISGAWEGHLLSTCIDAPVSIKAMVATKGGEPKCEGVRFRAVVVGEEIGGFLEDMTPVSCTPEKSLHRFLGKRRAQPQETVALRRQRTQEEWQQSDCRRRCRAIG